MGTWLEAVSPTDEAEKVNVPMLLIHGDADARVSLDHVTRYRRELDKWEKEYEYIELPNAAHFFSTLNYKHREDFLHCDAAILERRLRSGRTIESYAWRLQQSRE